MPLFQFRCLGDCHFEFSGGLLSIRKFDADEDIPSSDLLSKYDLLCMREADWALITESTVPHYKSIVSLLLIAFRLPAKELSPMIKYRLSTDPDSCATIHEELTRIRPEKRFYEVYSMEKLKQIDGIFTSLLQADRLSPRLHNAYYFFYRAMHTDHWIDSYIFYMSALESLFGVKKGEPVTRLLCHRIVAFLGKPAVTLTDIRKSYDTRSRMLHGDLPANGNPDDNLDTLQNLEEIALACLQKLVEQNLLLEFSDTSRRDAFMSQLDSIEMC